MDMLLTLNSLCEKCKRHILLGWDYGRTYGMSQKYIYIFFLGNLFNKYYVYKMEIGL